MSEQTPWFDHPWRDESGNTIIECWSCLLSKSNVEEPNRAVTIYQGNALCADHLSKTVSAE